MKYSVPNAPIAFSLDQAEPDDFDFQALGDRRTGIVWGGDVTALGSPGASVDVAAGVAIIADQPIAFEGGTVAVANGGGNPRFDIIAVAADGALANISGATSANALFKEFDFSAYAPLAAVYVPQGATSVLGSHIVLKASSMPNYFIRTYTSPQINNPFLQSTVTGASASHFSVRSSGEHVWGSNKLKRITDYTMEWATSLLLKAIGIDSSRPVLILQSTDTAPASQKLLQTIGSIGTETAYINGAGQLYADNFKFGTGNPNNTVVGKKGDIYIDRAQGGSSLSIWQKGGTDGTKTSWSSLRIYDPSESALPTGAIIFSLGGLTPPIGFIGANGQLIPTTGSTADLAALIGSRYGSTPGNVRMPDLRGMTLAGAGDGLTAFDSVGVSSMTLSIANLPRHAHHVNDPGHEHPQPGPYAYIMPWQFHNNRHPVPSSSSLEHIYTEPSGFNRHAKTGISVGFQGESDPISMYQPTHPVNVYVKL